MKLTFPNGEAVEKRLGQNLVGIKRNGCRPILVEFSLLELQQLSGDQQLARRLASIMNALGKPPSL